MISKLDSTCYVCCRAEDSSYDEKECCILPRYPGIHQSHRPVAFGIPPSNPRADLKTILGEILGDFQSLFNPPYFIIVMMILQAPRQSLCSGQAFLSQTMESGWLSVYLSDECHGPCHVSPYLSQYTRAQFPALLDIIRAPVELSGLVNRQYQDLLGTITDND